MIYNLKSFKVLILFSATVLLLGACAVQKRHYQKGFYVASSHKPFKQNSIENALVNTAVQPDSCATFEFTDGTSIKGTIVSITGKEVFYRYCVDDGKDHKCLKQRLKSITYPNGKTDYFEPNTRPETPQPVAIAETKTISVDTVKGVAITQTPTALAVAPTVTSTCDVVIFKDGSEEDVIVKEINDENVRYKLCSMPDGPDFVKSKSQIFMIKYRGGQKEVFKDTDTYPQVRTVNQNADPRVKPREGLAMASLASAILGIYPLWLIGSIVGLILGLIYLQKNRIDPKLYPEQKVARAGVIISLVMLGLFALALIAVLSLI